MAVNGAFALEERRKFESLLGVASAQAQDELLQALDDFERQADYEAPLLAASGGTSRARWAASARPAVKSRYLLCIRDLRGRFVKLSHSWETNLGASLASLQGVPMLKLVHPADVWLTHDRMEAVRARRAMGGFSNRYRCSDGGYRQLEWTAKLFGDQVFGIARDVTDLGAGGKR